MTKGRAHLLILLFLRAFLPGLLIIPCPAFLSSCSKVEPFSSTVGSNPYEGFINSGVNGHSRSMTGQISRNDTGFFHSNDSPIDGSNTIFTSISIGNGGWATKSSGTMKIRSLDIFVFNEGGDRPLDSYERIEDYRLGTYCNATSTAGRKRIVLIANCPSDKLMFSNFSNYEDLQGFVFDFADDDPEYPLMCGEANFYAGKDGSCTVNLNPLLCEVVISEIKTSAPINSISVRLKNINTRTTVLDNGGFTSYGIEPTGQEFPYRAGLTLYCYPYASEGGLGSPHTEINIVCRRGSDVREYNIVVNGGNGIERNSRYVYTINLK